MWPQVYLLGFVSWEHAAEQAVARATVGSTTPTKLVQLTTGYSRVQSSDDAYIDEKGAQLQSLSHFVIEDGVGDDGDSSDEDRGGGQENEEPNGNDGDGRGVHNRLTRPMQGEISP